LNLITFSIGFLTSKGNLFCRDLLGKIKEPAKFFPIKNHDEYNESIEKLKKYLLFNELLFKISTFILSFFEIVILIYQNPEMYV